MQQSPFKKYHESNGAHFVEYAGWNMPIRYGSVIDEHNACRTQGGFFDVSHMGRLRISGRHARKFLERVLTRRVTTMQPKQCRYALVCNEQGGVLDDVIVYRYEDDWMLVVNAANRQKINDHFEKIKANESFKVDFKDATKKTAMVAVQGPNVMEMIGKFSSEVPTLKRYTFALKNLIVLKMTISRTGYTGEDGVEIILDAGMAEMAIKMLLKDKTDVVKPCGLAARDSLRLEAGMPLYGHELDEQTSPLEAGLDFAVNLDKGEEASGPPVPRFIGQNALIQAKQEGLKKTLIGLKIEGKRTPRQGASVMLNGAAIGSVTSGCSSPTLGAPIAMAYVAPEQVNTGDLVNIDIGSTQLEATVCALPFYKRS